ncbi:MAG: oligosaccharide flippase family protein [Sphingomicrobium sp.]
MGELRRVSIPSARRLIELTTTRTGVVGLTTIGNLLVRTLSSVVLTRLLNPEAFGIVGIIGAIFYALTMLSDLGFQSFVVRHPHADERHFRDVIWTIHAGRGAALAVIAAAASPLVAWVLGKPLVALPLAVASLSFFLNGIASLSLMVALRHDGARKLSLLDFALQVFLTIATILLAMWWRNAWSMIAAMLLQGALRVVLSYTLFPASRQTPARDPVLSREFLVFSRIILATSAITLVILQTDKLILARLFTLGEFGLYAIALNIAAAPGSFADSYITRVVYPVYAQIWRTAPGAIGSVYYRVRRSASVLYALGCGGLIGGASLLVAILYDPRYAGSATYISLLTISIALRLPNFAAAQMMIATGQTRATLHANIVRLIWLVLTMPLGFVEVGPIGVVASVGLIEVPAMLYSWVVLRRAGILDMREELLFLGALAVAAAAAFGISAEVLKWFPRI